MMPSSLSGPAPNAGSSVSEASAKKQSVLLTVTPSRRPLPLESPHYRAIGAPHPRRRPLGRPPLAGPHDRHLGWPLSAAVVI